MTNIPLSNLPVPFLENTLTLDQVEVQLPKSLLHTLERAWYENFQIYQYAFEPHISGDIELQTRFLQVKEVIYSENVGVSFNLQNMQNVISSLRDSKHALVYAINSEGNNVKMLTGVRSCDPDTSLYSTDNYSDVLYRALRSNYPGIVLRKDVRDKEEKQPYSLIPFKEYKHDLLDPLRKSRYLAAITGIPSLRTQNNVATFSQSIDRLVDALRGESYSLLILAEPILDSRLTTIISSLRALSEEVHTLVRNSLSISRNQSITDGTSKTQSTSMSLGLGQMLTTILGISVGHSVGDSVSNSRTEGTGASWTQEKLDKTAQFCEQVLDHFINRVQAGRNLGFWNVGVYLASNDNDTFLRSQAIARSLYSGYQTYFEPLRVINLSDSQPEVRDALASFRNPTLNSLTPKSSNVIMKHPLGTEFQSLGTPLTTEELSIMISFPTREVPGLKLTPMTDFNLNPPQIKGYRLGSLLYRGEELSADVSVSSNALTRHTFVTGLTGSGKTNTVLSLLKNAYQNQSLNFLIVDPAKWEYRYLMHDPKLREKMLVFTFGDESMAPFRFNPFDFPRRFPLLTHIDLLKAVFNAAFPMYASMPYLLEEAVLEIYTERGWNVASSTNRYVDINNPNVDYSPFLPRFKDLYNMIDTIVERKKYGREISENLSAALKARLSSLMVGSKGLMLDTQRSVPFDLIIDRPVLLELRAFGDDDEKALLMSLIFIALFENCWTRSSGNNLQHIMIIEEAHRLLRNMPITASAETANPRGKSVEMFTDMMAEMRAHGEGFIIVDQMPGKLVPDVIKGSNLKIVHRLMAEDDRMVVGNAMGMSKAQIDFLPRLKVGQAIIHSEELGEPCLVKIDSVEDALAGNNNSTSSQKDNLSVDKLIRQSSKNFYKSHPEIMQKFSSCFQCDAPCSYQPESNMPTPEVLAIADKLLYAIAIGTDELITQRGKQLHMELGLLLKRNYPRGYTKGYELCLIIQTASMAVENFYRKNSRIGNWDVMIKLQEAFSTLLISWPFENPKLMAIRKLILENITIAPQIPKVGCINCTHQCWFGHLYQKPNNPAVVNLTSQFKSIGLKTFNPEKLINQVAVDLKGQIASTFMPFAAYCLLAQATDDSNFLSALRRIMDGKNE